LTQDIRVEDFEMLTRILFKRLKSPNKKFTEERNKILYDFAMIVQVLATKYTKLKEQKQNDKLAAKEQAQKDKLAAKEQAQKDKLDAKEQAQKDKLAAKEQAQKDKLAAKEQAQKDKLNQRRELADMRIQEREMKKCNRAIM
jgi:regulator of protease activity HflC (stomatin/prohibitin superfamily)